MSGGEQRLKRLADPEGRRELLSRLVRRSVVASRDEAVGHVADVVVLLRDGYPRVIGLAVRIGGRSVFVPSDALGELDDSPLRLTSSKVDLLSFERRDDEIVLRAEILRHRLIEIAAARFVRAYDVALGRDAEGWYVRGIKTKRQGFSHSNSSAAAAFSDWMEFEPLIGHLDSARLRSLLRPLRRLKAAQIADLLESASKEERPELLDLIHEEPDLEADVFEEVDSDLQARLLSERDDADIAVVLTRMHADDAADAIADLPQERRSTIIDLLPEDRQRKVLALLGFNPQTAGGLMVPDCLTVPPTLSVSETLEVLRTSPNIDGAAATTVYVVDAMRRLTGAVSLASLVRARVTAEVGDLAEEDPVHVHTDADVVELALVMSDYNLLLVPVTKADL